MAKYILVDGLHNCVPAQFVQQIHQYSLESCRNHFTLLASPTYPYILPAGVIMSCHAECPQAVARLWFAGCWQ